jgi:hypothetical protein
MNEELMARAEEFGIKLIDTLESYSPEAAVAALEAARANAIQLLVEGFMWLGVSAIFFLASIGLFWACVRAARNDSHDDGSMAFGFIGTMFMLITAITFTGAVQHLSNVAAWFGINNPEVYLAHRLLF